MVRKTQSNHAKRGIGKRVFTQRTPAASAFFHDPRGFTQTSLQKELASRGKRTCPMPLTYPI